MAGQYPVGFPRSWFIFTHRISLPACWLVIVLCASGCGLAEGSETTDCEEGNQLLEEGKTDSGFSESHRCMVKQQLFPLQLLSGGLSASEGTPCFLLSLNALCPGSRVLGE